MIENILYQYTSLQRRGMLNVDKSELQFPNDKHDSRIKAFGMVTDTPHLMTFFSATKTREKVG